MSLHKYLGYSLFLSCSLSFAACGGGSGVVSGGNNGGGGISNGGGPGAVIVDGSNVVDTPTGEPTDPNDGGGGAGGGDGGSSGGGSGGSGGGGGTGNAHTLDVNVNPNGGRASQSFQSDGGTNGDILLLLALKNTTAFQTVIVTDESVFVASTSLTNPSNAIVLEGSDPLESDAFLVATEVNSLNYPSNGGDAALGDGTYTQRVIFSETGEDAAFTGTIVAKTDNNLSSGGLRINVFLVGDSAQTGDARTAIDSAVAQWRTIYSQAGITLTVKFLNVTSDTGVVPNPFFGSDNIEAAARSAAALTNAINVFVGDEIAADDSEDPGNTLIGVLGLAPSIPGPAIVTRKSGVAVGLIAHEGLDGAFSPDETTLLAETMAHEVGHYLGLYHPVECGDSSCSSGTFLGDDPLGDTPTCASSSSCISSGIGSNVMFPVPLSGVSTQENLTANQDRVMNLQAVVD